MRRTTNQRFLRAAGIAAVTAAGLGLAATPAAATPPVRYDGYTLARVLVSNTHAQDELEAAGATIVDNHPDSHGWIRAQFPPDAMAIVLEQGFAVQTLSPNVQHDFDEERARLVAQGPTSYGSDFLNDFRDLDAVYGYLDTLVAEGDGRAELVELGTSWEGRPIRGLFIRGRQVGPEQPEVLLNATVSARDWLSTTTATCIADKLVRGTNIDPELASILDRVNVSIVPVVNPDGYVYSWETDRNWRKNRRDGTGVDLRRNFPVGWRAEGEHTENPDGSRYHGTEPLSEPESAALADYALARTNLVAYLDYQTRGQCVLYPWDFTETPAPMAEQLVELATIQSDAIRAVHGQYYRPEQASVAGFITSGSPIDWAHEELGVPAFAIELRPQGPIGGHVIDPAEIIPTCEENLAGFAALVNALVDPVDAGSTSTGGSESSSAGTSGDATDSSGPATTSGSQSTSGSTGGEGTTESPSSESTSAAPTSTPADDPSDDSGCNVASGGRRGAWTSTIFMVLLLGLRRRRCFDTCV